MTHLPQILVIDDELQIRRALRAILTAQFQVTTAARGMEGLIQAAANPPDLVVLDLGLPDMDGLEVCAQLREWTQVPIIVLSVRDAERDKVAAFNQGADDYLTKPFGIEELLARIRVALRHATQALGSQDTVVVAGPLMIDLARHVVTRAHIEVPLTATEFKLLAYLAANADRVLTHQNILTHIWGPAEAEKIEYLRVYMRQLRTKLEDNPKQPRFLLTESGVGYRFMVSP